MYEMRREYDKLDIPFSNRSTWSVADLPVELIPQMMSEEPRLSSIQTTILEHLEHVRATNPEAKHARLHLARLPKHDLGCSMDSNHEPQQCYVVSALIFTRLTPRVVFGVQNSSLLN